MSMENNFKESRKSFERKQFLSTTGTHLLLGGASLLFILPFVWMVLTSLKPLSQVNSPNWLPQPQAQLTTPDLIDPEKLIQEFVERKSPVSEYLYNNFSDVLRGLIDSKEERSNLEKIVPPIINDLNALMVSKKFKEELAFSTVKKSARVDELEGDETAKVLQNRYVLRDAMPELITPPSRFKWINYLQVFDQIPYARYYWNSILTACWSTFLTVLTSALAAFSFARLKWPGRDKVFMMYLGTMMLPGLVMMIPNYQIMIRLGLVDTLSGLVIPGAFTAFGTFLMRQFMMGIPESLDEAAEIDGSSKWRLFWDIILPLSRPGLITLAIFSFMGQFNSFFWPLVMIKSQHLYTLPIGLLYFDSTAGQETNLLMAAVTMSILPMIIIFVFLQRYLVNGIQLGGVKE